MTDSSRHNADQEPGRESPRRNEVSRKRRYTAPVLVDYGPISKLTRTGSFIVGDASGMMMTCL